VYLNQYQLLPYERTAEILRDLHGCESFSQGTLANFHADCAARLEPVEAAILVQVAASPIAHFDETGVRATGSLHWLHTVCTQALTWYYAHKKRGTEAMDAAGVLPTFQGRAIHDFLKSYLKYGCTHGLCNAHLLRELDFLHEQHHQAWAQAMNEHLLAIKQAVANARTAQLQALPDTEKVSLIARYNCIVEEGYAENPRAQPPSAPKRRGRRKQSKALNLLDRFRDHSPSILAFLHDFAVPFDNNQAERDLRMMKVRQKISGTFRSFHALENFCRIRGYVSTARKNSLTALDALRRLFLGDPFLPTPNSS
jgi:transposase